jgi:hypothetical protein
VTRISSYKKDVSLHLPPSYWEFAVYADHVGFFAPFFAALVACALLAGCNKETRQKGDGPEPKPAQQAVSPSVRGPIPPNTVSATQPDKGQVPGESQPDRQSGTGGMDDESRLVGDWKGESIVVAKNTAAKDEVVVWHIARGSKPGKVFITADKIVDDKAITMGRGWEWEYDKTQKTIVSAQQGRVWRLNVKGNSMEGTLTEADQTVFRWVSLKRSE